MRTYAEREHELRNGLSGLAGITRLLAGGAEDERTRRARTAAVTELHRLTELVDSRRSAAAAGLYCASEIVDELAALWRIKGMDLQASVPAGLMAVGRPSALAQVLTNLLVNCARHAPGAPVRIVTCERDRLVVHVRNEGTGLPADGRASTAGEGVGLEISRRLLRDEGGELQVHPSDPRWPGWTVSIFLVAAREQPDAVSTGAWRAAGRGPPDPVNVSGAAGHAREVEEQPVYSSSTTIGSWAPRWHWPSPPAVSTCWSARSRRPATSWASLRNAVRDSSFWTWSSGSGSAASPSTNWS